MVLGVGDDRHEQALPVGGREPRIAVGAPLHRRSYPVAVAEVDVVAHPDLVAVVDDRRPGQGEEQAVHQLDPAAAVAQKGSQPAADAQVDPGLGVVRVDAVHVIPLLVGDHLERELVVVAEEQRPLGRIRDRRRLGEHVDDRKAILHPEAHEQPGHQREVKDHLALAPVPEVGGGVVGPLVRSGEQHSIRVALVDVSP